MSIIPEDILRVIYNYVPLESTSNIAFSNKFFLNLYKIDLKKIVKIQNFYKKNRVPNTYLEDANLMKYLQQGYYFNPDYNDWNRFLVYRYYIAKYDFPYLIKYPEFLTNKAIEDNVRKNQINTWINNNLPPYQNRTRRDIMNFFVKNEITSEEIFFAGW